MVNPWFWLGGVVAALSLLVGGYAYGVKHERGRQALAQQSAIVATFEAARSDAAIERASAISEAERRGKEQTAVKVVTRRIIETRTVPGDCLPSDFVMQLNAAIDVANHPAGNP